VAKCLALGATAVAIGHSALIALNCNKEIPGVTDYEGTIGVPAGYCYHCHTGRCPVGITTQDPELRKRLVVDDAAERVYNFLHTLTLEVQMLARACGKTNVHSLEPEDLCALTVEADGVPAVFDRYSNSFLKIYFTIPPGRENELARKVLVTHLQSGNSYGIQLKRAHAKFRQPELGPWVPGSAVVGEDWKPTVLEGWEPPAH